WRAPARRGKRFPAILVIHRQKAGAPAAGRGYKAGLREILMADGNAPALGAHQGLPHNIEAEQALLDALLVNNDVYDRVASLVQPPHFAAPDHAPTSEVAAGRIRKTALAPPVTIRAFFEEDAGLAELGGPAYLGRLAGAALSLVAVRDYAQHIY